MDSHLKLHGHLAFFSGLSAALIGGAYFHLFVHFQTGLTFTWPAISALQSWESLIGSVVLALLFQWGLPPLCASAFFFGVGARRLWTARIGMAAAAFSLVLYALFIWALYMLLR